MIVRIKVICLLSIGFITSCGDKETSVDLQNDIHSDITFIADDGYRVLPDLQPRDVRLRKVGVIPEGGSLELGSGIGGIENVEPEFDYLSVVNGQDIVVIIENGIWNFDVRGGECMSWIDEDISANCILRKLLPKRQ